MSEKIGCELPIPRLDSMEQKPEEIQEEATLPGNNQDTLQNWSNLIVERIEEALFSLDKEWHFTYLNNQAAKLLGKSREALLGKVIWEEFSQAKDSNFEKLYRQAMADGKPNRLEDFSSTTQGWYDVRVYPIDL